MALNTRQRYVVLAVFALFIGAIIVWKVLATVMTVTAAPAVSVQRDSMQMIGGYNEVKSNATQNDVIAIMGSQFAVRKCPAEADPNCAHIWHYETQGQAWDFTFDMDGNLMMKKLGTADQ